MFDPYGEWLGIPRDQRPINCFVLLGIDPGVKDPKAIRAAAEEQAGRVQEHAAGPYAKAAARLLKEINLAKVTLLDPEKRKAYLARLRQDAVQKKPSPVEVEPIAEAEDEALAEAEDESSEDVETEAPAQAKAKVRARGQGKKKAGAKGAKKEEAGSGRTWLWISLAAAAVLLVGGGLAAFFLTREKKPEPAKPGPVAAAQPPVTPAAVPPTTRKKEEESPPPPPPRPKEDPTKTSPAPPPPPPPPPPQPAPAKPPDPRPVKVAKLPVPDQAAQDRAEKALKEKYKDDYARLGERYKEDPAKRKPDELLALAAKFLQPGREDRKDPALWFVLLREARDLAVLAARPRLAAEAVHEIDKWFQIDAPAMTTQALTAINESAKPDTARVVGQVALTHAAHAVDEDNYDGALKLVAVAEAALARTKADDKGKPDERLQTQVTARKAEVETWQKAFADVADAKKKLTASPDDPAANLAVGRHRCFFHGDWNEGLPLLAKGSDVQLKNLAQKDLARPGDAKGQITVADGWWNLAKLQSGRTAAHVRERAAYWYESAEPNAPAADQVTVTQRINETLAAALKPSRHPPGSIFARGVEDRVLLLREAGGTMRTEEAIEKGLEWLAQHQDKRDGHWGTDTFPLAGKCTCSEPGEKHDIAGTAFGLLPFLGAGQTHRSGKYKDTVRKGLEYLVRQQKEDGKFSADSMYENALGCIAFCEAFALSQDTRFYGRALAAADYIARAQNGEGGWGYSPGAKGDTSVTGWQFSALKTAYYAGIKTPALTYVFNRVPSFLETVRDPNDLGYGYNTPGTGVSTSAVGLLCRQYLGWGPRQPAMRKGIEQLLKPESFPSKTAPNIYFLFYATQVMHHAGGKYWEAWNPKTRDLLLDLQDQGTTPGLAHQKGSFSPRGDAYAKQGGRLMFTSLALVTLESYYYTVPLYGYGPALMED